MTETGGEKMRRLRAEDIPAASQLSAEAGWNQTAEDWQTLLELSPEGCLAIEVDGHLAATTTLLCYGRRLAWIGMVLTKAEYQRRGFARRLLAHALENADDNGNRNDQTRCHRSGPSRSTRVSDFAASRKSSAGHGQARTHNYQPTDHRRRSRGTIWIRRCSELTVPNFSKGWLGSALRHQLSQSYLFTRPGRVTAYLGPCVSEDARHGSELDRGLRPEFSMCLVLGPVPAKSQTRWRWRAIWDFLHNGISCAWLVERNCAKRKMRFTRSQDLNSDNRENQNRIRIGRIALAP